jgi:hypothetical protein
MVVPAKMIYQVDWCNTATYVMVLARSSQGSDIDQNIWLHFNHVSIMWRDTYEKREK